MKKISLFFLLALAALSITGCGPNTSSKKADISVEVWGPKSMVLGQIPNMQKDGSMAVWFRLSEAAQPNTIEAWVGGQKMGKVNIKEQKGAFLVEVRFLDKLGKLPMHLVLVPSGKQIPLGDFNVMPSVKDSPEINVTAWGPQSTQAGKGFNIQKNGVSAIWFKMSGVVAPGTMEAWFGDRKLENFSVASDKGGGIQIPQELLAKTGEYPVYLVHNLSRKRYEIGKFLVK